MKPVIICGGIGSKMWPESRAKSPKHFLPLLEGKSLFELNWEMLRKKYKAEEIYLQTNALQAEIAKKLVPEIVGSNIFVEPEMRNQGPATGFAAASLIRLGFGDEPFMLIQADLVRMDENAYITAIDMAGEIASRENVYVTGGRKPIQVVEGVDYLVKGELIEDRGGVKLYRVADYIDRTEKDKIRTMIESPDLLLHWNHTAMTPNNLLAMYKKYKPEWAAALENLISGGDVAQNYALMPKGPIEEVTAKAERSGEAVVLEFPFEIWDFGTWESVSRYLNEKKLYKMPEGGLEIDSNNNFIRMPQGKMVATIGVENLIVIDSGDALLITTKDKTGRVGEVVDKLKADGKQELL